MAQTFGGGFLTVTASGISPSTGAASAVSALPLTSSGSVPRYVRVAARNESYVRLGTAGATATNADILVQPADCVVLMVPNGVTHIAYIQGTAPGIVNVVPLENS